MSRRKPPLTELGKALRHRDADLRSAWERDYAGALTDAEAGKITRLLDLLRAYRSLTESDFDRLADFLEATLKGRRGRGRDAAVHAAVRIAETFLKMIGGVHVRHGFGSLGYKIKRGGRPMRVSAEERERAIEKACAEAGRAYGAPVDKDRVRDLLSRPRKRRAP